MISFDAIAKEVFQILRSYDYTVMMYDDEGNQVYEPEECRRFFAKPANLCVSIVEAGDSSSVRLYLGKRTEIGSIEGLLDTLRITSTKYNMIFNVRRYERDLEPAQFATRASVTENKKKGYSMDLLEGMYGTTRSSYLKMENARMIVRHSKKIDETVIGSRGRHIDAIFCENAQGERFLFPTRSLAPARAMTQHLNHGGGFADQVGQQITRMAQDYSNLGQASGHIAQNSASLAEGAMAIRETCRGRMLEMRRCFERLSRVGGYVAECKRLEEEATQLNEGDGKTKGKVDLGKLKGLLTCEGVDLNEAMLESVAECMGRAGHDIEEGHAHEKIPEMTHVLGQRISVEGWAKLQQGKVDLKGPVVLGDPNNPEAMTPKFGSKTAELSFRLSQVIPACSDDTVASFLSFVSEALQDPSMIRLGSRRLSPQDALRALRKVGMMALAAAGVSLDEGLSPNHEAVREFEEWMEGFDTDKALAEEDEEMVEDDSDLEEGSPYDPDSIEYGNRSQDEEDAVDRVMEDFSVADFLQSKWGNFEDGFSDDTEKSVGASVVKRMVSKYLSSEIASVYDLEDVDCDNAAESLVDEVITALQAQGWTVEMSEDMEFSREDVILPSNQGADLKREVTAASATDPETGKEEPVDAASIDRLRTLSGQRGARYM